MLDRCKSKSKKSKSDHCQTDVKVQVKIKVIIVRQKSTWSTSPCFTNLAFGLSDQYTCTWQEELIWYIVIALNFDFYSIAIFIHHTYHFYFMLRIEYKRGHHSGCPLPWTQIELSQHKIWLNTMDSRHIVTKWWMGWSYKSVDLWLVLCTVCLWLDQATKLAVWL